MSADPQPCDPCLASPEDPQSFPFLSLPLEIRLEIYAHLLPPRTHVIVTKLPTNGFFYNTALLPIISPSSPSFYPFGRTSPPSTPGSANYKVLTSNLRSEFPLPSIYPAILRVSKQLKEEAEPILYGGKGVEWDHGIHIEAMKGFWGGRSPLARESVRHLKIAKEIPCVENRDGLVAKAVDEKWASFTGFVKMHMSGLRTIDLTIWGSSGLTASFPASSSIAVFGDEVRDEDSKRDYAAGREWKEWEWTKELLGLETVRKTKITTWNFQNISDEKHFDSWLAGRMVGDRLVKERMIGEEVVVQEVLEF